MSEYLVTINASFDIEVDADSEEEAIEIAENTNWDEFDDCTSSLLNVTKIGG